MLAAAEAQGIDVAAHRSRLLDSIAAADLVVGFERIHVAAAVVDGGAQRDRVFTLPELVPLLERAGVSRTTQPLAWRPPPSSERESTSIQELFSIPLAGRRRSSTGSSPRSTP